MDKEKAKEIYDECINMNLSQMQDLIANTASSDEQSFYVEIYNYVLRTRQKKVVSDGRY